MFCFNPRTHTGCDLYDGSICNLVDLVSIHAPTRGATLQITLSNIRQGRFNPRTHTGCDIVKIKFAVRTFSFNPRTHTGCDTPNSVSAPAYAVSIHAPTRGATPFDFGDKSRYKFQSTHPHGVRPSRFCFEYWS